MDCLWNSCEAFVYTHLIFSQDEKCIRIQILAISPLPQHSLSLSLSLIHTEVIMYSHFLHDTAVTKTVDSVTKSKKNNHSPFPYVKTVITCTNLRWAGCCCCCWPCRCWLGGTWRAGGLWTHHTNQILLSQLDCIIWVANIYEGTSGITS